MNAARSNEEFGHRVDRDGQYVSFCLSCYQTVARSDTEAGLVEGEKQHQCGGCHSPIPFS